MKGKRNGDFKEVANNDFNENGLEELPKWYEELPPCNKKYENVSDEVLIALKDEAKKCLDSEVATFNIKNSKTNANHKWMKTIMAKGTVSDKIAAYTVLIQEKPVYNLDNIRNLISMVKVGKKQKCIVIIETLSELFLSDLLRPENKLKPFHQQPLSLLNELSSGNAITRRKYLSCWYFEDQLKEAYTMFVQALNAAAHDTVESNKEKAISAMYKLLSGNPEQEKNLLMNVINKLGDPSQKVASKAMYCLTQLLHKHSNMQSVVLKEVEKLLFRPNIGHKAQYYSLCFLSQFYLCHESQDVARKLIEVYFSFFKKCIKEGEVDSRLMSALLMGVNRAYPYAKLELEKISEHIDTMYRVVHVASFNISLHALSLLYQISECSEGVNNRFYSALYKKLLDPALCNTTHQAMLLNLIYKSLLRDNETNRISAFIKRLFQICMLLQPNFACGVLYLISHILTKKGNKMLLTLKGDGGEFEVKNQDEMEKNSDLDEEIIELEEGSNVEVNEIQTNMQILEDTKEDIKPNIEELNAKMNIKYTDYDPLARNPLYSGVEHSAFTELTELKNHFHPSVSLFIEKILKGEKIIYTGDPLKDFTLIRFLDRFVFKNPKRANELEKQGVHPTLGKRKNYVVQGIRSLPVTSASYLNEKKKNIPVDELFMHTYLQQKFKNRSEKEESDNESVCSEEFEEMLDKMSGLKDLEDDLGDDVDYMEDVGSTIQNKKQKKAGKNKNTDADDDNSEDDVSEDSDDELDDSKLDQDENDSEMEEGESDIEMDEENDDILNDLSDDDDASDISFDSEDIEDESSKNKKGKKSSLKKKRDNGSVFASADEFASILEDDDDTSKGAGTSHQVANKDRADVKQLDWEKKRNYWLKGYKKAFNNKTSYEGKKNLKNKRPSSGKFGGKSKIKNSKQKEENSKNSSHTRVQ